MNEISFLSFAVAVAAALTAAATDLRQFRIPNVLTLPLLAFGFLYHAITGGINVLLQGGTGALTGLILLFPLYVVGAMGAGDVKLTAGLGAWLGPLATCEFLFIACSLTALASFALLSRQRRQFVGIPGEAIPRVEEITRQGDRRSRLVPFGVPLAVALLAIVTWNHWSA